MLTQQTPLAPKPSRTAALLDRFRTVRAATMTFCSPLTPEDMMVQSCAEASPVKWHLAHTSWFFETFVLSEFVAGYQPFDPNFHWLFNSYYHSLGEMPEKKLRASFSRPPLDQILAYRCHVDAAIERLLAAHPPKTKPSAASSSASSTSSSTSSSPPPTSSTPSSPTRSTPPTSPSPPPRPPATASPRPSTGSASPPAHPSVPAS